MVIDDEEEDDEGFNGPSEAEAATINVRAAEIVLPRPSPSGVFETIHHSSTNGQQSPTLNFVENQQFENHGALEDEFDVFGRYVASELKIMSTTDLWGARSTKAKMEMVLASRHFEWVQENESQQTAQTIPVPAESQIYVQSMPLTSQPSFYVQHSSPTYINRSQSIPINLSVSSGSEAGGTSAPLPHEEQTIPLNLQSSVLYAPLEEDFHLENGPTQEKQRGSSQCAAATRRPNESTQFPIDSATRNLPPIN